MFPTAVVDRRLVLVAVAAAVVIVVVAALAAADVAADALPALAVVVAHGSSVAVAC